MSNYKYEITFGVIAVHPLICKSYRWENDMTLILTEAKVRNLQEDVYEEVILSLYQLPKIYIRKLRGSEVS